jgi:hypothetical protein
MRMMGGWDGTTCYESDSPIILPQDMAGFKILPPIGHTHPVKNLASTTHLYVYKYMDIQLDGENTTF